MVGILRETDRRQHERINYRQVKQSKVGRLFLQDRQIMPDQVMAQNAIGHACELSQVFSDRPHGNRPGTSQSSISNGGTHLQDVSTVRDFQVQEERAIEHGIECPRAA